MAEIVACIAGSSYDPSVCEHAARFAGTLGSALTLANAAPAASSPAEPKSPPPRVSADPMPAMVEHLASLGVEGVGQLKVEGPFPAAVQRTLAKAALVVAGKRGDSAPMTGGILGRSVRQLLSATNAPVCLASRVYLPFTQALVLLEAEPDAERSLLALERQTWLTGLRLDVVVTSHGGAETDPLVQVARRRLAGLDATVFPLPGLGLAGALEAYLARRACELLVLDRGSLLGPQAYRQARLERWTPWDMRAPVMVV